MATGYIVLVIVLLVVGGFIGAAEVHRVTKDERDRLAERERRLQAEWDALEQKQRLDEAFWRARITMRNEALWRLRWAADPDGR